MDHKININLSDIEKTLLIPLWSRAKESEYIYRYSISINHD